MKPMLRPLLLTAAALLAGIVSTPVFAATCTSAATGNWSVQTTWGAVGVGCVGATGGIPGAADTVTIAAAHTVTVDVNSAATSIAVTAPSGATNGVTLGGGVTLNVSGAISLAAPAVNGRTSTFAVGTGALNAGSILINGGATATRISQVTVSSGAINVTGAVTSGGTAAQAQFISSGAGSINIGGNFTPGAFTAGASTLTLNGAGAQSAGAFTYNNLIIAKTVGTTATLLGATIINGGLTASSGTLSVGAFALTVTGTTSLSGTLNITSATGAKIFAGAVTINPGGVWNNSGNSPVTLRGGLAHGGATFTAGTGVYTFNTNPQTISGTLSIPSVTVTGVTLTNTGTLTVATALAGTGGLTNTTTLNIGGTSAITTLTASAVGNIVNYTGGGAQTIKATTYDTLNTSGAGAKSIAAATIVNNTLSVAGGTLTNSSTLTVTTALSGAGTLANAAAGALNIGGNSAITTLTATAAGNTVNYTGAAAQTIKATTYDTLNTSNGGAKSIAAPIIVNNTLSVTGGTLTNNSTLTVATALSGAGTLVNAAAGILNIGGTSAITTLTATAVGNIVNYTGAAQTLKATAYSNLNVSVSATNSGTVTVATALGGAGTLTNAATGILNIGGTSAIATLTATAVGNIVNYTGAAAQTIKAITYDTLNTSGAGAKSIAAPIIVNNTLSVTGGTLTNSSTLTVTAALSGAGTLVNAAAGILNIGGTSAITTLTATAVGNTVNYTGAAQLVKATAYHHLDLGGSGVKTLTGVTTVGGNLILSGTASATTAANFAIGGNLDVGTGTTFTVAGFNLTVTGATSVTGTHAHSSAAGTKTYVGLVTMQPTGTWTNAGNSAFSLRGGLTHNGATFTAGTGVYTFNTNAQAIGGISALSIPSVTVTGVTLTNNGTLTVGTALVGTGGLTNTTTLNIGGTSTITTLTATVGGNTVNYTGAAQTVKATAYHHLGLGGSGVKTLTGVTTVGGDLTLSGTASATTAANFSIGSNLTVGVGATFTSANFTNLVTGATSVSGTLAHSGVAAKTYTGTVTINPGGVWTNAGNAPINFGAGFAQNGTFTSGSGIYTFNGGSLQSITGTSTVAFTNLAVSNVASPNILLGVNVTAGTLTGTVTLSSTCPTDYTLTASVILHSCAPPPNDFNCVEAAASSLNGHLFTKLAGTGFSFDVVARKLDGTVETTYASGSTTSKTITVELVDGSGGAACNLRTPLTPPISQNLTFTAANLGRKLTAAITVNKAYPDLLCRVTDVAIVSCSTDHFSVRPGAAILSTTATAVGPSAIATPVIKAGTAFTIGATTTTGATDSYTGTLTLDTTKLSAQLPSNVSTQQSGGTVGTLTVNPVVQANPVSAQINNANWDEVGYLYAAPGAFRDDAFTAVDSAQGDCVTSTALDANLADTFDVNNQIGCSIGNKTTVSFGRFIPDHFLLTPGSLINRNDINPGVGCTPASGFTYMGEPLRASFVLTAQNTSNNPTVNYTGGYARFASPTWASFNISNNSIGLWAIVTGYPYGGGACKVVFDNSMPSLNLFTSCTGATPPQTNGRVAGPRVTTASSTISAWASGLATFTTNVALERGDKPDGPYGTLNIGVAPQDSDGVQLLGAAFNLDADNNGANERALLGTTEMRFGVLKLGNVFGSELLNISVPVQALYLQIAPYQFSVNTQDHCTTIAPTNIAIGNQFPATFAANFTMIGNRPASSTTLAAGTGTLILKKPAPTAVGGWADIALNLTGTANDVSCNTTHPMTTGAAMPWLQGNWCGGSYAKDPSARITFGIPKSPFIFMRERY